MQKHIDPLESRTLLSVSSVTPAQLQADKQAVNTNAAALTSSLVLFFSQNSSFTQQIARDFASLPASDKFLLNQLIRSELKSKSTFSVDAARLNAKERAVAAASVAAADSLIAHPSVHGANALGGVIVRLNASYTAPLAALTAQIGSTTVDTVRTAITTLLASDPVLVADLTAQKTEITQNLTAIAASASTLVASINTLAADLTTVKTDVGTFPSLVGTFNGALTFNAGRLAGQSVAVTLTVLTENPANGKFSGSLSGIDASGSNPVTGSTTLAGNTTLRAVTATDGVFTLSGIFDSPTVSGRFSSRVGRGLFVLTG